MEDDVQVVGLGPGGDLRALERREHRRHALTFRLVTGGADGVVDLVAAGVQLVSGPLLAGQFLLLQRLFLAQRQPGVEVRLGFHVDHHRHETVVLAAQFGALAAVDAGLVDLGPGFVDEAGDGVALDREGRHPPGVDHVAGGDQEAHLDPGRDNQRVIHLQQVVLALLGLVVDLVLRSRQVAEELHVLAQVLVVPLPLVAGDLDIDFRLTGVVHLDQGRGSGNRHGHQDQEGHDGPEDFDGGAFVEMRRLLPGGTAVDDHRPEHRAEDQYADHDADPEDRHVQIENGAADLGCTRRHVHRPGGICLAERHEQKKAHPDSWMSQHSGSPYRCFYPAGNRFREKAPIQEASAPNVTNSQGNDRQDNRNIDRRALDARKACRVHQVFRCQGRV
ncbi:hypothetical protein D3C81_883790 [compost metagenome]